MVQAWFNIRPVVARSSSDLEFVNLHVQRESEELECTRRCELIAIIAYSLHIISHSQRLSENFREMRI